MRVEKMIKATPLPKELLPEDFKQFRVATKSADKKVTIDIDTGMYATGPRVDMPLYTYHELNAREEIQNGDYLQFIPEGTPYTILDFDTDKNLTDEERKEQVVFICEKVLGQFDGRIELSSSKLGVHAYIQDERVKNLPADPFKFKIEDNKHRHIDVEVFASNAPIILTNDMIEEGITTFDTVPVKLMKNIETIIQETPTEVNDDILHTINLSKELDDSISEKLKTFDTQNRLEKGYADAADCSKVDYAMAKILLRITEGNRDLSFTFLYHWMQKWRPHSLCKKSVKEIKNKASRAINSAYKTVQRTDKITETPTNITKTSMREIIMQRSKKAHTALEKVTKSKNLAHNVLFEGTLNVLYAKSGSGKTKIAVILTMEIALQYPDKFIYYFAPDLSVDDIIEIKKLIHDKGLTNYYVDQDSVGKEFLEMIEKYGKCEDVSDLIFVVDTLKKIASVNNKDGMSKTMGILKQVTLRGATGIIVAHTNKDGHTISGTAEVEQDSDNVLTVATKYIGDDSMRVTVMASELRCRSRIEPVTLDISRDGFSYEFNTEHVNIKAIEAQERELLRMGNIIEIAKDIVTEYAQEDKRLTKTQLQKEIRDAEVYTGNKKNETLSKMIDKLGENHHIRLSKEGRSILCTPFTYKLDDIMIPEQKKLDPDNGKD